MEIHLTARHFRASKALRERVIDQISKLEKFDEGIVSCDVILSQEKTPKKSKKLEIIMRVHRSTLTCEVRSDDFMKAIGESVEKIERRIKKYKSKKRERYETQQRRRMLAA